MYGSTVIDMQYMHLTFYTGNRCDNFSTPANGEITSCSSGIVGVGYEGDTCSFTCNTGYGLTGSSERTCQVMVVGVDHQCPVSSWSVPHHHYQ